MFYWLTKYTLGMTLKIVFRPRAWGVKNVPRRGPVILASNHLSFSDHFFGPLPVPRKVIFLGKAEYFTGRGLKGLISKIFFTGVGVIPLDRGGGAASERAIRTSLRVLADGNVLGIYPEGTRSPDGRLYRGKTGVARLAVESGAPVVPCAMIDTFQFQPPGTLWPNRRFRPGVRFGEPLDFSRYHGQEADGQLLRTITDEILQAIAKLSGQEYVDIDARRAKAELAAGHRPARAPARAPAVATMGPVGKMAIWMMSPRRATAPDASTGRRPGFVFPRLVPHASAPGSGPLWLLPCEWVSLPVAATAPA